MEGYLFVEFDRFRAFLNLKNSTSACFCYNQSQKPNPSLQNPKFRATRLRISFTEASSMDSINFLKGYGKVNSVDQQLPYPPRPARRSILLAVSFSVVLLLTLTIGLLLGGVIHDGSTESAPLASDSAASIRAVCRVTQHPDSCFSSLSSLNCSMRPDPVYIFKLSLDVSVKELSNASLFVKHLKEISNDVRIVFSSLFIANLISIHLPFIYPQFFLSGAF